MNGYDDIRRNTGWFIALGVALIVLGMIAVGRAVTTTLFSVILFGWLLFFGGVIQAVHAFRARSGSGLLLPLLGGILNIIVGLLIVANPGASAGALTLLLALFFIAGGIFRLVLTARGHFPGRSWSMFSGLMNVLLGLLIWFQWPVSAFWVIGLFIGIDPLSTGWWFALLGMGARRVIERPA